MVRPKFNLRLIKVLMLVGMIVPAIGRAESIRANFNEVTCFEISDPGSNSQSTFIVKLDRKSKDRHNVDNDKFDVTVERQLAQYPGNEREKIGSYTAIGWEFPNTQEPYHLQFDTGYVRRFELGLYRTNSLPWADLWMVTNTGSNLNEEITKQLECELRK